MIGDFDCSEVCSAAQAGNNAGEVSCIYLTLKPHQGLWYPRYFLFWPKTKHNNFLVVVSSPEPFASP